MITQMHFGPRRRAGNAFAELAPMLLTAVICLPFLVSGVVKLIDPAGAAREVASLGLPAPSLLAWMTIAVQLLGSFAAVFGSRLEGVLGCLALASFTVMATLLAHAFWHAAPSLRQAQLNAFIEHLSITAGLLFVAWLKWRNGALPS